MVSLGRQSFLNRYLVSYHGGGNFLELIEFALDFHV